MKYLKPFNESHTLTLEEKDTIEDICLELSDLGLNVNINYTKVPTQDLFKIPKTYRLCDKDDPRIEHIFITINKEDFSATHADIETLELTNELIGVINRLTEFTNSIGWKPRIELESSDGRYQMDGSHSFHPSYLRELKKQNIELLELEFNLTKTYL